jgi:uncharacterized protein (DUF1778 family)
MSVDLMEPPAVAKNAETTLRADAETASVVRRAAALKGLTIAEYLREIVLPIARRDLVSEAEKITRESRPKKS